jgi:predicted anti-sigma-YlaC factor YlaD
MSCESFRDRLEAHGDGLLDEAGRREVDAHLRACPACAGLVRRAARLAQVLGASGDVEPSPGMEARFLARLRAEAEPRASAWRRLVAGWRGWALAAAGAAAAAAVALAVWPRGEGPASPAPAEVSVDLLRNLDLLRNFDTLSNLETLEGVTPEELDAVAELPELGG